MNYRDFYKSNKIRKEVSENMEEKELLKGINLEDNACDDGLPKRDDGSLDTAHDGRPIHLSKIVQIGKEFGNGPSSGELSGFTAISTDKGEKSDNEIPASEPEDKETLSAGGKFFNSSVASKSVGGPVTSGKGQKQGGPNTKGSIAGTPNINSYSEDDGTTNLNLQEAKSRLHAIVKEVLKEITFDKSSGKWMKKSINEGHDAAGFPDGSVPGRPQYKVVGPQYRVQDDNLARSRQFEPEITEMHDEEEECMMNERYSQLVNAQRNLTETELSELKDLGMKLEKINENHKEHEHKEVDLIQAIKHAAEKLDNLHKGEQGKDVGLEEEKFLQKGIKKSHKGYCTPMSKPTCTPHRKALAKRLKPGGDLYKGEEEEFVNEAEVNMKMGPSYKVVQPTLAKTSEPDQFSRTNEYDPEVSEAGGAAVQHSSYRTVNDKPQLTKNRHRGDIDESEKIDEAKKKVN